jgi:hypothetical protein
MIHMKKMLFRTLSLSSITFVCTSLGAQYPTADEYLGEKLYPNEANIALQTAKLIEKSLQTQYKNKHAFRDVHAKATACVKAKFRVNTDIKGEFAQGVFVAGKTYDALIRFSNGSGDPFKADIKNDGRGMAIKLFNVDNKNSNQDFLMINHSVFFINDPKSYFNLIKQSNSESFFDKAKLPFTLGFTGISEGLKTSTKIASLTDTRYFSATAFQLGTGPSRQAIKFSVEPLQLNAPDLPKDPSPNFLTTQLQEKLKSESISLTFSIQPKTSKELSVENASQEWPAEKAPFYKVATIEILQQDFVTDTITNACESLSFSPWNTLPAHKPLGAINRMRQFVYEASTKTRNEINKR